MRAVARRPGPAEDRDARLWRCPVMVERRAGSRPGGRTRYLTDFLRLVCRDALLCAVAGGSGRRDRSGVGARAASRQVGNSLLPAGRPIAAGGDAARRAMDPIHRSASASGRCCCDCSRTMGTRRSPPPSASAFDGVRYHLRKLFARFRANTRAEVVQRAREHGRDAGPQLAPSTSAGRLALSRQWPTAFRQRPTTRFPRHYKASRVCMTPGCDSCKQGVESHVVVRMALRPIFSESATVIG